MDIKHFTIQVRACLLEVFDEIAGAAQRKGFERLQFQTRAKTYETAPLNP